ICLIAGAILDLLEPALWVLAILANITALQRIAFTRRAMRDTALLSLVVLALIPALSLAGPRSPRATHRSSAPPPIPSGARAVTRPGRARSRAPGAGRAGVDPGAEPGRAALAPGDAPIVGAPADPERRPCRDARPRARVG